jgi:tetratricopeptide (TPR) repeat protein
VSTPPTETAIGQDHLNLVPLLDDLADLYFVQNQYDKAELVYLRELSILEKSAGEAHPRAIAILGQLVTLYTAQGNPAKAQELIDRISTLRKRTMAFPQYN